MRSIRWVRGATRLLRYDKYCSTVYFRYIASESLKPPKRPLALVDLPEPIKEDSVPLNQSLPDRGAKPEKFYESVKKIVAECNALGPKHVALIQVGSFYELYFDHAERFSRSIGLKLAVKQMKEPIVLSGFPVSQLSKYVRALFDLKAVIVIFEQVHDPLDKKKITRPVSRILTPGTLSDELREYSQHCYLLSVVFPENAFSGAVPDPQMKIGLSWTDLAFNEVHIEETTWQNFLPKVAAIDPAEILIDKKLACVDLEGKEGLRYKISDLNMYYISYQERSSHKMKKMHELSDKFISPERSFLSKYDNLTIKEKSALVALLNYIDYCRPGLKGLEDPKRSSSDKLLLSRTENDGLELFQIKKTGSVVGTLYNLLNVMETDQGMRTLKHWIQAPSKGLEEISSRQDMVDILMRNKLLNEDIRLNLSKVYDLERLLSKITNGKSLDASLFNQFALCIEILNSIKDCFQSQVQAKRIGKKLMKSIDFKKAEALRLSIRDLIEEPVLSPPEYPLRLEFAVVANYDPLLLKLRRSHANLNQRFNMMKEQLESEFISELGCKNIRFVRNTDFPKHCIEFETTAGKMPTLENAVRAHSTFSIEGKSQKKLKVETTEWSDLCDKSLLLEQDIKLKELDILTQLATRIVDDYVLFVNINMVFAKLDVLRGFGSLAATYNWSRPVVDESLDFIVVKGRHPTVEKLLLVGNKEMEKFHPNDCRLSEQSNSWLVTGPNMGGKSTFLKQNAIIAIMAQMGSFVPAESAKIGVIDRLFVRMGSLDNIASAQSTFFVQALETANLLTNSSKRSFILIDEPGTGTAVKEGIGFAASVFKYLTVETGCRVLCSTHFGRELEKIYKNDQSVMSRVKYYQTSVDLFDHQGKLQSSLSHQMKPGINTEPYTHIVCKSAGVPDKVIELMNSILKV